MRSFRTDTTNFIQGARDGTRIAAGAGVKIDFRELAPDASTSGLWHLHDGGCQGEGSGLADASGHGRDLVNHGAVVVEDGYQFTRGAGDYMQAAVGSYGYQAKATVEAWVRGWGTAGESASRMIVKYLVDWSTFLAISARRAAVPYSSAIVAWLRVGSVWIGPAQWTGSEADAVLASPLPWHVAAVLDAPTSLRLYVNGALRAMYTVAIASLPSGNYLLNISDAAGVDNCSAIVDEVRLSSVARYNAPFTPGRLLASGMYTSMTLDSLRLGARWIGLAWAASVPPLCGAVCEVRAADTLDSGGRPEGIWGSYLGDPATLPVGRYFQWRADLSSSPDRGATPLIESTEATVSDRGYNLYRAAGPGPESVDYAEPCARVGPEIAWVNVGPLQEGAVHWFGIRPVDAQEREIPVAQGEARLELDAQGEPVPDRPAGALAAVARATVLGTARLQWCYRVGRRGVVPLAFRIFGDGGTGVINYATPLGEVPYGSGQSWYTWTSGQLAGGAEHQLAVRAVTAEGVWDEQPAIARVAPDAAPPAAVDALEAETVL
jgi:hypothetical protein